MAEFGHIRYAEEIIQLFSSIKRKLMKTPPKKTEYMFMDEDRKIVLKDSDGNFRELFILNSSTAEEVGKYLFRKGEKTLTAGSNNVVFDEDFGTDDYTLLIDQVSGVGCDKSGIVKYTDKFTISALDSCTITYIAIKIF